MGNSITDLVDHAAKEDDRYLVIALVIIGMIFAVLIWKWMIADREKMADRLTKVTDRHIEVTEKLSEVVASNTAVLHEVRKKL